MFLLYRFRRGRAALCAVLCAALLLLCSLPRTARDAAPAWQAFSGPVCRADTNGEPLVALTFETLGEGDTARLLEVLADHGAKATFFVEGRNLANQRLYEYARYREPGIHFLAGIKANF